MSMGINSTTFGDLNPHNLWWTCKDIGCPTSLETSPASSIHTFECETGYKHLYTVYTSTVKHPQGRDLHSDFWPWHCAFLCIYTYKYIICWDLRAEPASIHYFNSSLWHPLTTWKGKPPDIPWPKVSRACRSFGLGRMPGPQQRIVQYYANSVFDSGFACKRYSSYRPKSFGLGVPRSNALFHVMFHRI